MAEGARSLLYQHGVGLAFLATVRPDGGPRLHPFCPVLNGDEMYGFILPSPKQEDLRRDGRYAVHSFPTPDNEDAFMVTGRAFIVPDAAVRSTLAARFVEERVAIGVPPPDDEDLLVRFDLERGLLTRTSGFGDFAPRHEIWAAQQ
ncbi:MAG TPA: hypothetical protein VGG38_00390 [Acidimicrobiales bacterium]|jgi:hypothetical protein